MPGEAMPRTTYREALLREIEEHLETLIWLDIVEFGIFWDDEIDGEENDYEILMEEYMPPSISIVGCIK